MKESKAFEIGRLVLCILVCQLAGELIVAATGLPLPGPVIGMLILFIGLVVKGGVPQALGGVGDALMSHLSLLFVPAGVGVMTHLSLLEAQWFPISLSLIISTLLTIAVTGLAMTALLRLSNEPGRDKPPK